MSIKRNIHKGLRIANDIDSIRRGTIVQRVGRRLVKKAVRKGVRRLFK